MIGAIVLACAAPAAVAAAGAHRAKTYKGALHASGGGKVSLTMTRSSVTEIKVTGYWTCENGIVPLSYKYTLRSRRGHPVSIAANGSFHANHLKFRSADLYDNMGRYWGSGSVSGTVRGRLVTGRVSVAGSTPDSYCSGGGRYSATLAG